MVNSIDDFKSSRKFRLQTIKNRSDFLRLKESGKKRKLSPWLLVNFSNNGVDQLRFGFTLSRKVGPSVVRNRLRRLFKEIIREYFKSNKELGLDVNFVFLTNTQAEIYHKINLSEVRSLLIPFFKYLSEKS